MWTPHWITVSCHGVEGPMTTGYYCAIFPFCGGGKKKDKKTKAFYDWATTGIPVKRRQKAFYDWATTGIPVITSSPCSQYAKIHHAFPPLCKFAPRDINGNFPYIELLHSVCSSTLERRWQTTPVWKFVLGAVQSLFLVALLRHNWCHVRKHLLKQWPTVKNWSTVSQAHLSL